MKITAQEEYGLRCLLRLARAADGQSLTIPEIAAAEGLSVPYVAKLLAVLRQAGLIESVRGRTGRLSPGQAAGGDRPGRVLLVLGEPLFDEPGYCEKHAGTDDGRPCVHHGGCSLRGAVADAGAVDAARSTRSPWPTCCRTRAASPSCCGRAGRRPRRRC